MPRLVAIASYVCAILVGMKVWLRIDDSSDMVAVHLGGGVVGALCVGLFATKGINPTGTGGPFYGGGYRLLSIQAVTVAALALSSFAATLLVGGFIGRPVKQRVPARAEATGIDLALHGATAYRFTAEDDDRPEKPVPQAGQGASHHVTASAAVVPGHGGPPIMPGMPPGPYSGNGTQTYDPQTGRGR